jgi:hypothetical protein
LGALAAVAAKSPISRNQPENEERRLALLSR